MLSIEVRRQSTAALTHNQSKAVGKKLCDSQRKGPSSFKRPEVDCYIDPVAHSSNLPGLSSSSPIAVSYPPVTVISTIPQKLSVP